jgi:hypothetical protein
MVLYLEFHPHQVDPVATREVLEVLSTSGFEIVSAVSESGYSPDWQPTWYGERLDIKRIEDLLASPGWIEVVARRR